MERAEAIKIIKSATVYTPEEMEALETLITELRGNEDERIIRAIIDALYSHTNSINLLSSRGYQMGDIEAWLEKQKDASKAIEAVDRIDKYIDEHLANAHDMKDSNPDKKYYSGWDDALGKMSGILQDVYSGEKQKDHFRDDAKMVEQKSAEWSEEDEKNLELVIDCIYEFYPDPVMKYKLKDWLKSLSKRFNLQPKQEWSDEDKGILLSIKCVIDSVWHNFDYDCSKEELKEMWDWLDVLWQKVEYSQPKQEWSEENEEKNK